MANVNYDLENWNFFHQNCTVLLTISANFWQLSRPELILLSRNVHIRRITVDARFVVGFLRIFSVCFRLKDKNTCHCWLKFVNWLILIFSQRTFLVYQCKNNCSHFAQEVYHQKPFCFYSNLNLIVLCGRINIIVNMHKFVIQWSTFNNM